MIERPGGATGELELVQPSGPRFLTPAQVAVELALTEAQAYSLMRSGEIGAVRIGKRRMWRASRRALEAYVERLEAEARQRAGGTPG